MTAGYPEVTLDCYMRATASGTLVDSLTNALYTCDEEGRLDGLTVEFWPDDIRLADDTEETAVRGQYRTLQAWADNEGVSLEPAFIHRERKTPVSDDADTVLVLPVLCLAIRVDGELVSVAPHTTETTVYTVSDALADIQSLPRVKDLDEISPTHPARSMLFWGEI